MHRNDLCASLQYTLIQIILHKIEKAANEKHLNQIVIGGGVAANSEIRKQLDIKALARGWEVFYPPLAYTTDKRCNDWNCSLLQIATKSLR